MGQKTIPPTLPFPPIFAPFTKQPPIFTISVMSASTSTSNQIAAPRKPHETQKGLGGDMSMMFFVRTQIPKSFSSAHKQQIKGLNFETFAAVPFPTPQWMEADEYAALRPSTDHGSSIWRQFSLNFSLYPQKITETDWEDQWFFMYGRVHPYALTWEHQPEDSSYDADEPQEYTIPALIVRDLGYQPLVSR
jgi:hypothetical protein